MDTRHEEKVRKVQERRDKEPWHRHCRHTSSAWRYAFAACTQWSWQQNSLCTSATHKRDQRGSERHHSAVSIPAQGGNFSQVAWGSFVVFDNIIKEYQNTDSQTLGRVTGWAVSTTMGGPRDGGVQMMSQHVYGPESPYNGSSLTIVPGGIIPGGTGYFQGYSGYRGSVDVTTVMSDLLHIYKWDIYLFKYT
uniref:Dirigent protein n=1 Tax=Physcomitrium patens TaxID=3218 RepID=A0A2K1JJ54_PHYPA|nr:hypothetical protein PHYPA_018972 [Physcomitrium patens]